MLASTAKVPNNMANMSEKLEDLNDDLILTTRILTGTRPTMHYLGESADLLVTWTSDFNVYIKKLLLGWKGARQKKMVDDWIRSLDTSRESYRDKDKLETIRKNMQQNLVDIKAIQQHVDINVGIVRNMIAEKDSYTQRDITANTYRDGFTMKIVAVLSGILLPATVVANILAGPMFDFASESKSSVVRVPYKIFWEVAASLTSALLLYLSSLWHRKWVMALIDHFPIDKVKQIWKHSRHYASGEQIQQRRNRYKCGGKGPKNENMAASNGSTNKVEDKDQSKAIVKSGMDPAEKRSYSLPSFLGRTKQSSKYTV
ncbi:hypothetical protein VTL71DRAFT_12727 [Oculimacula yallundae]|uniref:Uncharacterized protein n=1 Tax=Oculimacula yallundae TaxID=86028 RepID=A0ABR4CPM7_9HELO